MTDPVFMRRRELERWERAQVALVCGWTPEIGDPVNLVLQVATRISRVRQAHVHLPAEHNDAHLLTPESDNG